MQEIEEGSPSPLPRTGSTHVLDNGALVGAGAISRSVSRQPYRLLLLLLDLRRDLRVPPGQTTHSYSRGKDVG